MVNFQNLFLFNNQIYRLLAFLKLAYSAYNNNLYMYIH